MLLPSAWETVLDDMTRADLEGLRNWYATCIFWSTAAVIVGCVMEVPEVLHELWENIFPDRFIRPVKIVSSVGLLFVVLGVGGELAFDHWRSGYEELLQRFDNILLASAQQNAGDAKDSAQTAATASTEAQTASTGAVKASGDALHLAQGARKEADTFEADIQSANAHATDAESHLAEALERANRAEKESIHLRDVLGGWQLDDEAKERFMKDVQNFPGTPYDLAVNPVEAPFMEQLDGLLTSPSVGWTRLPPKPDSTLMAILIDGKATIILTSGIILEVDRDQVDSLTPAIIALGTGLHKELGLEKVNLHKVPPGTWGKRIHIIIGKRQ